MFNSKFLFALVLGALLLLGLIDLGQCGADDDAAPGVLGPADDGSGDNTRSATAGAAADGDDSDPSAQYKNKSFKEVRQDCYAKCVPMLGKTANQFCKTEDACKIFCADRCTKGALSFKLGLTDYWGKPIKGVDQSKAAKAADAIVAGLVSDDSEK